jgi:multidrug efflux pump subunit AcrB
MFAKYSVRRPMTVFVAVIMVIILGVISFTQMPTDLLPSIDLPYLAVITAYPGANPEKVEQTVTKPLESSLSTVGGVEKVTSISQENSSMVIFQFSYGTNMDSAMIEMSNKADMVKATLDDGVGAPVLMKINPDMLPVMVASADVSGKGIEETSILVSETVIPALERISGVASVTGMGLVEKQLTITLSQEKIDALNQRVLDAVDGKLNEAQALISQGLGEIENQRSQLAQKAQEEGNKLDQAESALTAGKDQALEGLGQVSATRTLLQRTLQETMTQRDQLKTLMDGKASLPTLNAQIESARLGLSALDGEITGLKGEIAQRKADKQGYEEELSTLPDLPENAARRQELQTLIAGCDTDINQKEAALSGKETDREKLSAGLTTLTAQRDAIVAALAAMGDPTDEELSQSLAALDGAIAATQSTLGDLTAQEGDLTAALSGLNEKLSAIRVGRNQLNLALSQGAAALAAGEQQLRQQSAQLDSARETARDEADLSGLITQQTIAAILAGENFSMPAGYLTEDGEKYAVKVGDQFGSLSELQNLALFTISAGDIGAIRLSDVADIAFVSDNGGMYAKINGNDGILLSLQKQSTASTSEVSAAIRETMKKLEAENTGLHMTALSDQGVYIDIVTGSVLQNLAMGGILAILILFLFLHSLKPTFIVAVSIPISLTLAVVLMYFTGVTLNAISLAGLALGVGMLVDNSIVVIENIYRLRQEGVPVARAAVQGAKEVAGAIAASTLTTICVFLPIVFTQGISRELFTDMGLTIAYSLLASLLIALTMVPALSSTILRKQDETKHRLFDGMVNRYSRILGWTLSHKALLLVLVIGLLGLSVFGVTQMGTAFMPETDSQEITVSVEAPSGSTQAETRALGDEVMERIMALPGVETVGGMQSSATGGNTISIYVRLADDREHTSGEIAQMVLDATDDLSCDVTASGSTMDISAMAGKGIQVNITGDDLDTLQSIAQDIAGILRDVSGTTDVSDGMEDASAETRIVVDKNKALEYGLTVAQVYQQVAVAITAETEATTVTLDAQDYAVVVSRTEADLPSRDTLMDLGVTGQKDGAETKIPLSEIAALEEGKELQAISHSDQVRSITASAMVDAGHNIGKVGQEVQRALADYQVPEGYTISLSGENETIQNTMRDLVFMVCLAVVMIYLIMVAQFQSLLSPFIVMFTLPLAFTGGLLALWIFGFELSVISMLGFLVLAGVIVNNGIVFVDCVNRLRLAGMDRREALIEAGRLRIRPILMTALTTILGLCTLAFGMGMGADMLQPMAVVIVGGLTYATLLTLFVVPVMYDIFQRKSPRDVDQELEGL